MLALPKWLTVGANILAAAAAPALTSAVDQGVLAASTATWIGGIVLAVVGTHHGTTFAAAKSQAAAVKAGPGGAA